MLMLRLMPMNQPLPGSPPFSLVPGLASVSSGTSAESRRNKSVNSRLREWDKKVIQPVTAEIRPISIRQEIGLLSV